MKIFVIVYCLLCSHVIFTGCATVPQASVEERKHSMSIQFLDLAKGKIFDGLLNGLRLYQQEEPEVELGEQDRDRGTVVAYVDAPWAVTGPDGTCYDVRFTMTAALTDTSGTFVFTELAAYKSGDENGGSAGESTTESAWFHQQANRVFHRFLNRIIPAGINRLVGNTDK